MIIVYVKHYLTPEGMVYFEKEWWERVQSTIRKQKGFVSLVYRKSEDEDDCIDLTLKFNDEDTLDEWASLPAHEKLIEELIPYRSRKYMKAVRTSDEQADPNKLAWISYAE